MSYKNWNQFYYIISISAGECKIQNIKIVDSSIKLNTNKNRLDLYSGDTFGAGASINLYSKNTSYTYPGAFRIATIDNEGNSIHLFGDGIRKELWWNNNNLSGNTKMNLRYSASAISPILVLQSKSKIWLW